MKNLIVILTILFSILIPQETYEFTEEQVLELFNSIKELEHADSTNQVIIENLESQMQLYIQSDSLFKSQIEDYKTKLQYKDEMIELVKPQWYENKYLWFGFGVIFTAGSVHLAGQIN